MPKRDASRRRFVHGLLAAVLVGGTARAAPPTRPVAAAIEVTKNECFDEASLAAGVDTWLGGREVDARLAVTVEGTVQAGRGFTFAVRRDGELVSERHFSNRGVSCPALSAILSLAISMALDASLPEELKLNEPPVPKASEPHPSPPSALPLLNAPRLETPQGSEPAPARPSRGEIDFGAVGLVNALPVPALGMELGAELSLSRSVAVRADAFGTSSVLVPVGRGSADASLVAVGAGGCFVHPWAAVKVRVCAGGKVGWLSAQGLDYPSSDATHPLWAAASLRLDASLRLAPNAYIRASMEPLVLVVRPELEEVSVTGALLASTKLPAVGLALGLSPSISF